MILSHRFTIAFLQVRCLQHNCYIVIEETFCNPISFDVIYRKKIEIKLLNKTETFVLGPIKGARIWLLTLVLCDK